MILVLVKVGLQKGSQVSPTTHLLLVLVKEGHPMRSLVNSTIYRLWL
jgi:hypothetical protein